MDIEFGEAVLLLDGRVDVIAEEEEEEEEEEEALVLLLLLLLLLIACTWDLAGCGICCAASIKIVIINAKDKILRILGTFNRLFILQVTYQMIIIKELLF